MINATFSDGRRFPWNAPPPRSEKKSLFKVGAKDGEKKYWATAGEKVCWCNRKVIVHDDPRFATVCFCGVRHQFA